MARYLNRFHIDTGKIEKRSVKNLLDRIIIQGWGSGIYGWIVYLHQGAKAKGMRWMPVGEQHMGDIEMVALDSFDQFQIYMTWINKYCLAAIIGTDEISIGVFHQGEVEEYLHSILREAGLLIIGILERDSNSISESEVGVFKVAVDEVHLHKV